MKNNPAIGADALAFTDALLTPEEITESNLRVALVGELIKARQEKGISQKKLEELSGVKQPVIARMERGAICSAHAAYGLLWQSHASLVAVCKRA